MHFDQHDRQVRDTALKKAFPIEKDVPDRFAALLARLAETENEQAPRKQRATEN